MHQKKSIVHQAFIMDKGLQERNRVDTLHQHIINLRYLTKVDITSTSKRLLKQKLKNYYEKLWENCMLSTRGKYFKSFKQNILYEKYLALLPQRNLRLSLTKLRLSDHRLMIESGRRCKPKAPLQERILNIFVFVDLVVFVLFLSLSCLES